MNKVSLAEALALLPGPATAQYPEGAPSVTLLQHGSMSFKLFTPGSNADGRDRQVPHTQDELYLVQRGSAQFSVGDDHFAVAPGDAFFVPAGASHRFDDFTPDFATWVVFYGPQGGET